MNMVDRKMEEIATMDAEPRFENGIIIVIYDVIKSYTFRKMTDTTLESLKNDILEDCGSYISDLVLKLTTRDGNEVIQAMFKMAGGTMEVELPVRYTISGNNIILEDSK